MKDLKGKTEDELEIMACNGEITTIEFIYNTPHPTLKEEYEKYCQNNRLDKNLEKSAEDFMIWRDESFTDDFDFSELVDEENDKEVDPEEVHVGEKLDELIKDKKFLNKLDSDLAVDVTFERFKGPMKNKSEIARIIERDRNNFKDKIWYIFDLLLNYMPEARYIRFLSPEIINTSIAGQKEELRKLLTQLKEILLAL